MAPVGYRATGYILDVTVRIDYTGHKMYRPTRLYCFSPAVMLATFVIEVGIALFTLMRYRATRTARLIALLLFALALFQLAEYMVCEGSLGLSSLDWARIGYAAITVLPPLGLHIAMSIAGRVRPRWLGAAYGSAALFVVFFLTIGHGANGQMCLGNYVIFEIAPYAVIPYTLYYYGWLLATTMLIGTMARQVTRAAHRTALYWLAGGYVAFIVPTTLANIIDPSTIAGIPSIMCGFAVILALILLFRVIPLVLRRK